jgi:hypothetical protein
MGQRLMAEDYPDQLARLRLMATDDKWDLSDNDRAAIKAVLAEREALTTLAHAARMLVGHPEMEYYRTRCAEALRRWEEKEWRK